MGGFWDGLNPEDEPPTDQPDSEPGFWDGLAPDHEPPTDQPDSEPDFWGRALDSDEQDGSAAAGWATDIVDRLNPWSGSDENDTEVDETRAGDPAGEAGTFRASNPYGGSSWGISWEEGYAAGWAQPSRDHRLDPPAPLDNEHFQAWQEGALQGQTDAQAEQATADSEKDVELDSEGDFRAFLRDYWWYRGGGEEDHLGTPWTVSQLKLFAWADTNTAMQAVYDSYVQDMNDSQLGIYPDGRIETGAEHRERARRENFQRGLEVLTGSPFGAMTYGSIKALGGDENTALSAGNMADAAGRMAGGHTEARSQGSTHPQPSGRGTGSVTSRDR
ncbi:MAG: hypothetical protein ACRD0U_11735 [Acidimicrobiales bacterium]